MVFIPDEVAARLEDLAAISTSIQSPNFTVDTLAYHEPDLPGGQIGTKLGTWSEDDIEYEFSLVGQLSLHQTFLGPYGDLFHRNPTKKVFNVTEVCHAKSKATLAMPHGNARGGAEGIARRQFEALRAIEDANYLQVTAKTHGIQKSSGFVINGDEQWRASALSDYIFQTSRVGGPELEDFASIDTEGIVSSLPAEKREALKCRPMEFYSSDADLLSRDQVGTLFRPGTWVELRCKLHVWVLPEKGPAHARRSATRSYQVTFDAIQHLAEGRLDEGPLKTTPKRAATKRKFKPVHGSKEGAHSAKKLRFGDVVMGGGEA